MKDEAAPQRTEDSHPAEDADRDTAARLRLAMQAGDLAAWEIDLHPPCVRWSPEAAIMHGFPPDRIEGHPDELGCNIHPHDREALSALFRRAVRTPGDHSADYRVLRPGGGVSHIAVRGTLILTSRGKPLRMIGVLHDVTDRGQAEEALRNSEERFREAFEQSPVGKATADLQFRLRSVNPALCRMLGYTQAELCERTFLDLVHPDDRDRCLAMGGALVAGKIPQLQIEERFIRKSGEPLWVNVNAGLVRDRNGNMICTSATIENVDERRRTSIALRESEQRLRELNEILKSQALEHSRLLETSRAQLQAFFDNSPDWLTLQRVTPEGRCWYVDLNPTAEEAYGLQRDQVIGRPLEEILGVEEAQVPLRAARDCVRSGKPQRYLARRTMAGRTRVIDVVFALVPGEPVDGDRFIITTARDLTEQTELETELRHAQKMEAIGNLTGGVAHDFNNLLAVVAGNAELARRRAGPKISGMLENILRASERGAALTRQLLAFSRRQAPNRQIQDLAVQMPRLGEMLRTSLRGDIEMRLTIVDDLWLVDVDINELEIALLNVAVNARDAMPNGGRFEIDVCNETSAERDWVVITLRDSGGGIPEDIIDRVFDPFFTTKERGVGTGLGLSQVYGFVQQSDGSITIASQPGSGTTLTIRLPRTLKPLSCPRSQAVNMLAPAGGRILLVEDNDAVASVTTMMLTEMGFDVEVVDRARKALDCLSEAAQSPDLLLSDVVMPDGMNGLTLASEVRTRFPDMPIILISGYNELGPPTALAYPMLRKPVSFDELYAAVASALTRQPVTNSGEPATGR